MTNLQRLDTVRDSIRQWIGAQVGEPETEISFEESILIRDGFYCGRRFEFGDFNAVWFAEEQQIKFYDMDGHFLAAQSEAEQLERRAA